MLRSPCPSPDSRTRLLNEDYSVHQQLYKPFLGLVVTGTKLATGVLETIKIIPKHLLRSRQEDMKMFLKEVQVLRTLHHPNIADFKNVLEDEHCHYIVTEHCHRGSLSDMIREAPTGLTEIEALESIRQVLNALTYLHDVGVAHRNLTLNNAFIDRKGFVRLIEFGQSWFEPSNADRYAYDRVGERRYAAPELTRRGKCKYLPCKADVWSVGIMLVGLLVGGESQRNKEGILPNNAAATMLTIDLVARTTPRVRAVLDRMLCSDPERRATAGEAFHLVTWAMKDCKGKAQSLFPASLSMNFS